MDNYDRFDELFNIDNEKAGQCTDNYLHETFRNDLKKSLEDAKSIREETLRCHADGKLVSVSTPIHHVLDYDDFIKQLREDPNYKKMIKNI